MIDRSPTARSTRPYFSFFVYQEVIETPLNYKLEEGENPRHLEREQIVRLMNVIAEVLYIDKYDPRLAPTKLRASCRRASTLPMNTAVRIA